VAAHSAAETRRKRMIATRPLRRSACWIQRRLTWREAEEHARVQSPRNHAMRLAASPGELGLPVDV
jgi:hypothetical protein